MEPEGNRQSAGREIDTEMEKACNRMLQLVAEAQSLKEDQKAVKEKLREIISQIQKMKSITARTQSQS